MLLPAPVQTEAVLAKLPVEAVFAAPSYQGKTGLGVLKVGTLAAPESERPHAAAFAL